MSKNVEKTLKQIDDEIDHLQKKIALSREIEAAYVRIYEETSGASYDMMVMRRDALEKQLINVQEYRKNYLTTIM